MRQIIVGVAELAVVHNPAVLVTIGLGSCVGISFHDPVAKIGALAHVVLPSIERSKYKENPLKFADSAIETAVKIMLVYVGTVLLGLVIILCLYLIIVLFTSGMSPWRFLAGVREVMLLAFSTSSSAAVMPLSIKTAEEKLGVRPSISQFVIPLGATINMNGTALYQSVATVFLAQVFGMELGLGALLLIIVTVVGSSIGTPATPGVGIVILALVLNSVGIPTSGIALIIGVDRIVDMSRTAINVTGDLAACKVMDRWVGSKKSAEKELAEETERELRHIRTGEDVILDVD